MLSNKVTFEGQSNTHIKVTQTTPTSRSHEPYKLEFHKTATIAPISILLVYIYHDKASQKLDVWILLKDIQFSGYRTTH